MYPASPKSSRTWLLIAALTGMAQFFALLAWYWTDGLPFSNTSGIWTAYAWDLVNGEFYRPYFEETGYGGGRFMPLFFILLSGMMKLVGIPSTAGAILTLLTGFCFLLALVRLMQTSEVPLGTAVPFVLLACFSSSFQLAHLDVRSDLLASFLNLIALGFALRGIKKPDATTWVLMVVGFVLAWFSKITMGYGWVAISLYLLFKGRVKAGCGLFLVTASLAMLCWEILQTASGGKFDGTLTTFFIKETSLSSLFQVPFWFFKAALGDPFFLMLLGAALWILIVLKPLRGTFAEIYFWITFTGTLLLFTVPGTDSIHLIDLLAASLWVLACGWSCQFKYRYPTVAILPMLMIGALLTLLPGVDSVSTHFKQNGKPTFKDIGEIIKKLPVGRGPILSENPMIPILMGQKPFLLDAYSLRVLTKKFPNIEKDLFSKLEKKQFGAVILTHWAPLAREYPLESMARKKSLSGDTFYGNISFPEGFLTSLKKNYSLDKIVYPYYIFIPRSFPDNLIVFPAMEQIGR